MAKKHQFVLRFKILTADTTKRIKLRKHLDTIYKAYTEKPHNQIFLKTEVKQPQNSHSKWEIFIAIVQSGLWNSQIQEAIYYCGAMDHEETMFG